MRGIDVFCERCGARQAPESREAPASGGKFARRLKSAVTGTTADGVRQPTDSLFLRLCLECRGYSCPNCWNQEAAVCQTCAPLPEPDALELPQVDMWTTPAFFEPLRTADVAPVAEFVELADDRAIVMAEAEIAEPERAHVAEAEPARVAEPEPELVVDAMPIAAVPAVEPELTRVAEPEPETEPVVDAMPIPAVPAVEPELTRVAEPEAVVHAAPDLAPVAELPAAEPEPAPAPVAEAQPEPAPPAPVQPAEAPRPARPTPMPLPVALPPTISEPTPLPLAAAPITPSPSPALPRPPDPVVPAPLLMPRPRPQISFDTPSAAAGAFGSAPAAPRVPPTPPALQAAAPAPAAIRLAEQPYHLPIPMRQTSAPTGVRPCRNCSLAVSAKAHFCRRCGSAQLAS